MIPCLVFVCILTFCNITDDVTMVLSAHFSLMALEHTKISRERCHGGRRELLNRTI